MNGFDQPFLGQRLYSRSSVTDQQPTLLNKIQTSPKLSVQRGLSKVSSSLGQQNELTLEGPYQEDPDGLAPATDAVARMLRLSTGRSGLDRGLSFQPTGFQPNPLPKTRSLPQALYTTKEAPGQEYQTEDVDADDFTPLPPVPNEALPVVPPERLMGQRKRLDWELHPSSPLVLALLHRRGVIPELHRSIVEYHMAESFLDSLYALMRGSYFVRYAMKNGTPKERYFNIQLLPDANDRACPFLCWYIHRTAVQMIDKVPLDDLVGVSPNCKSPAFQRWLVSHDIIKGCMQGHHKNRMQTRGCFTLWFYDKVGQRPRSVDLLTNNMSTFTLWIKCLQGILSVNSTSLNGLTDAAQEMQKLMKLAQGAHLDMDDEDDSEAFGAQFVQS